MSKGLEWRWGPVIREGLGASVSKDLLIVPPRGKRCNSCVQPLFKARMSGIGL